MDSGRQVDLLRIAQKIADKNTPTRMKLAYARTREKIVDQMRDRTLGHLRERMMKASRDNNQWEMWKISCLIKDHVGEERAEYWQ